MRPTDVDTTVSLRVFFMLNARLRVYTCIGRCFENATLLPVAHRSGRQRDACFHTKLDGALEAPSRRLRGCRNSRHQRNDAPDPPHALL